MSTIKRSESSQEVAVGFSRRRCSTPHNCNTSVKKTKRVPEETNLSGIGFYASFSSISDDLLQILTSLTFFSLTFQSYDTNCSKCSPFFPMEII